jgi:hypothetical protein
MWPFEPRGRRQVYEGGGDGGGGGGDGGGDGGHEAGHDAGVQGGIDAGGFQGGDTTSGGFDASQEAQHDAGVTDAIAAGPATTGDPGTAAPSETYGPPAPSETYGPPAPTGGEPAPVETGTPAEAEPAGSAPQPGLDTPDPGLSGLGPYAEPAAAPTMSSVSLGATPSFTNIVEQFGPPAPTGNPFGITDPFAATDDEQQRGEVDELGNPVGTPNPSLTGLREGDLLAQGTFVPGGRLTSPLATPDFSVPDPFGNRIGVSYSPAPAASRSTGATPQSAPDDTPMTGLTPELAASLGQPTPGTPSTPTPDTPAPATAPDTSPSAQPDISPNTGYTDAERLASAPSTTPFAPPPNIGTAIMQALAALGSSTIGGPVAAELNQNLPGMLGSLGVPGVSQIGSALGAVQTGGSLTGLTPGRAGSPLARAQPNLGTMIWDALHGRETAGIVPGAIGLSTRPTVGNWLLGQDDRGDVGAAPPPADPRTYDPTQLRGVPTTLPGLPPNPTLQQLREALMVPQERDLTGGNQADSRVEDMLLAALGLEPLPDQPVKPDDPGTKPTPEQLPFGVNYYSGEEPQWSPFIFGQRTAFDPRRFRV